MHHLRQPVLAVGELVLPSLVLPPVRIELSGGVQHVGTARPDAVNVIAHPRGAAVLEAARLLLHELLEAVPGQRLVAHVVRLVLLCGRGTKQFRNSLETTTKEKVDDKSEQFCFAVQC